MAEDKPKDSKDVPSDDSKDLKNKKLLNAWGEDASKPADQKPADAQKPAQKGKTGINIMTEIRNKIRESKTKTSVIVSELKETGNTDNKQPAAEDKSPRLEHIASASSTITLSAGPRIQLQNAFNACYESAKEELNDLMAHNLLEHRHHKASLAELETIKLGSDAKFNELPSLITGETRSEKSIRLEDFSQYLVVQCESVDAELQKARKTCRCGSFDDYKLIFYAHYYAALKELLGIKEGRNKRRGLSLNSDYKEAVKKRLDMLQSQFDKFLSDICMGKEEPKEPRIKRLSDYVNSHITEVESIMAEARKERKEEVNGKVQGHLGSQKPTDKPAAPAAEKPAEKPAEQYKPAPAAPAPAAKVPAAEKPAAKPTAAPVAPAAEYKPAPAAPVADKPKAPAKEEPASILADAFSQPEDSQAAGSAAKDYASKPAAAPVAPAAEYKPAPAAPAKEEAKAPAPVAPASKKPATLADLFDDADAAAKAKPATAPAAEKPAEYKPAPAAPAKEEAKAEAPAEKPAAPKTTLPLDIFDQAKLAENEKAAAKPAAAPVAPAVEYKPAPEAPAEEPAAKPAEPLVAYNPAPAAKPAEAKAEAPAAQPAAPAAEDEEEVEAEEDVLEGEGEQGEEDEEDREPMDDTDEMSDEEELELDEDVQVDIDEGQEEGGHTPPGMVPIDDISPGDDIKPMSPDQIVQTKLSMMYLGTGLLLGVFGGIIGTNIYHGSTDTVDMGVEMKDGAYQKAAKTKRVRLDADVPEEVVSARSFVNNVISDLLDEQKSRTALDADLKAKVEAFDRLAQIASERETALDNAVSQKIQLEQKVKVIEKASEDIIKDSDKAKADLAAQIKALTKEVKETKELMGAAATEIVRELETSSSLGTYFKYGVSRDQVKRLLAEDVELAVERDITAKGEVQDYRIFKSGEDSLRVVTSDGRVLSIAKPEGFDSSITTAREKLKAMDAELDKAIGKNSGKLPIVYSGKDLFADIYKAVYGNDPTREQAMDMRAVVEEKLPQELREQIVYKVKPGSKVSIRLR